MGDTLRIEAWNWAREQFSHSDLANSQSTQRLVRMATTVAVRPAGCVSKVFTSAADSQGAYDFLENQRFDYEPLQQAVCTATLEACEHESIVFVPVDGSVLLLKDKYAKRTERITDDMMPTVSQATEWVARLGGYTGKSSGGPPGSITIGRGLTYLRAVADGLEALNNKRKTRG